MSKFLKIEQSNLINTAGIPNVFIRSIVVDINKVALNLCIKEKYDPKTSVGSWTKNTNNLKNMRIKAIICFDPERSKQIINKKIDLSQNFNNSENSAQQILHIEGFNAQGTGTLFKTKDSEGNTFYEIPYYIEFADKRITEGNLNYLSCIVFPYIESKKRRVPKTNRFSAIGKLSSDIIFQDFKLMEKSKICYVDDDKVYAGPLHKMSNGRLMEGAAHSSNQRYLKTRTVSNSKIQDFRSLKNIGELKNFSVNSESQDNKAEFSDIFLTKDPSGNVRFLFGVDCREVGRKNSKLGRLYENPVSSRQLMMRSFMKSIKIFRQREGEAEVAELIALSEDKTPRSFISNISSQDKKRIGSIEEVFPHISTAGNDDLRFFSVVDYDVAKKTEGIFNYRVELKIQDSAESYLGDITQELMDSHNSLKEYTSFLKRDVNPISNRFKQTFIDSSRAIKNARLKKSIRAYIENLMLFRNVSKPEQRQISRTLINITHPISGNPDGVHYLMKLIESMVARNKTILSEKNFLNEAARDYPSSTESTHLDIDVYEVVKEYSRKEESYDAAQLRDVGIDYLYGDRASPKYQGLAKIPKGQWENKAKEEGSFVSPVQISVGEQKINPQDTNNNLDFVEFDALLAGRNEKLKIDGKETYLDASSDTSSNILSEAARFFSNKSTMILPIAEVEKIKNQKGAFSEQNTRSEANKYIGAGAGFDAHSSEQIKFKDKYTTKGTDNEKEISKAFAALSQLMPGQTSIEQGTDNEARDNSQKMTLINKSNQNLNIQNKDSIIGGLNQRQTREIPNQILSLTTGESSFVSNGSTEFERNFRNNAEFNIKYNTLQRVEVLTGFGNGIKDPIWRQLTSEISNSAKAGLLVRLVPYSNLDLGIKDTYNLPVYNEYFFIGSPPKTAPAVGQKGNMSIAINNTYVYPEFLVSSLDLLEPSVAAVTQFLPKTSTRQRAPQPTEQPTTRTRRAATSPATRTQRTVTTRTTGMGRGTTTRGGGY